jgi:superfamily II DNA/RNA helicase
MVSGYGAAALVAAAPLFDCLPPPDSGPDAVLEGFLRYTSTLGLSLYPHQEEAILALLSGSHVIVHTPTGSGKSLIATASHFKALAEGRRSYYTCPIKALVSEKFFALCRELGPERVGMMTGDATVNRDASIICCTAEILANIALAKGKDADVDYVVMDEFHYFSDKERGVAWQVPLLTLPRSRFVLMSATLGDVSAFETLLRRQTGVEVTTVRSAARPVPLEFSYEEKHLQEATQTLVGSGRAPVYVVSFTQRGAAEAAQDLLSLDYCTKDEKKTIADALRGESFKSPNGKDIQKLLRHGIGLHHAGLLPRYRLLVEKLCQRGLLKIISGTDTLGVGVNVPIRTVLFTKLCKYDGEKVRLLSVRDFQQIAGRAGRKGFDERGFVVALAPEHAVENLRLEAKASSQGRKKFTRKKPPDWGYVPWDRAAFERLSTGVPEPLTSRFEVSHGMLLGVLGRPTGGCRAMKSLVKDSLESPAQKRKHKKRAFELLRSLLQAGIVEFRSAAEGGGVRLHAELQDDFSLLQTLGLFIVDAIERLAKDSPSYALDVLGLVESVIEDPEVILRAQVDKLKTEKLAELKAAGVEYDERMAELDKIEHPQPNGEFLATAFQAFAADHPWVSRESLKPKSIAREMVENLQPFGGYVKEYGLARSEGLLLRYLSEVYKTLVQTIPDAARTVELDDATGYLGTLVRGVDSSLLDEWERLRHPEREPRTEDHDEPEPEHDFTRDRRAFTALIRNLAFSLVRALAARDYETFLDLVEPAAGEGFTPLDVERALRPLHEAGEAIRLDAEARSPRHLTVTAGDEYWSIRQALLVGDEVSEFAVSGRVDLARSRSARRVVLLLDTVGAG